MKLPEQPLRIAMIAPPWLKIPTTGYGGVEAVIENLVEGLVNDGMEVEVFGVRGSHFAGAKMHDVTQKEEFANILKPMYDFSLSVPCAHVLNSLEMIKKVGHFDIIHDHNYFIGPTVLAHAAGKDGLPPAVSTVHGPPLTSHDAIHQGVPDNRIFWRSLAWDHDCKLVCISHAMKQEMPYQLQKNLVEPVYNAINITDFPYVEKKKNHFITLGRIDPFKGTHIAVKLCAKLHESLQIAGPVATIENPKRLMLELANPLSKYRRDKDFRYYSDEILPYVMRSPRISYIGSVGGARKMKFLSEAKALLFPIDWEEPFGMVMIEALACGTPVVAMNRGAVPEIIEHGVNGFIADTEKEFADYMKRVGEIDPAICRRTVEEKFSADMMAREYVKRYRRAIRDAHAT